MKVFWQNLNERRRSIGSRETLTGPPIDGRASLWIKDDDDRA